MPYSCDLPPHLLHQVLYMFLQSWVDTAVEATLGNGSLHPSLWLQPTVPLSSLPQPVASLFSGDESAPAGREQRVSPLAVVTGRLAALVNPPGRVGRVKWEFKSVKVRVCVADVMCFAADGLGVSRSLGCRQVSWVHWVQQM